MSINSEIFSEKVSLEWNEFPFLSKVTVKDENNFTYSALLLFMLTIGGGKCIIEQ